MRLSPILVLLLSPVLLVAQDLGGSGRSSDAPVELLGSRIGAEIDAAEREYFNLFPDVEEFSSAKLEVAGDGLRILLFRDSLSNGQLALSAQDAAFLRSYIENFEAITFRDHGSAADALLEHIGDPALLHAYPKLREMGVLEVTRLKSWTSERVLLVRRDSSSHEYALLAADDGGIYVWSGAPHHHPDTIMARLQRVPFDSLTTVYYNAPIGFIRAFLVPFALTMGMTQKVLARAWENDNDPDKVEQQVLSSTVVSALAALPVAVTLGVLGASARMPRTLHLTDQAVRRQEHIQEFLGDVESICVPPPAVADEIETRRSRYSAEVLTSASRTDEYDRKAASRSRAWAGGEYVVSMYGAGSQLYNVGLGLTFAREFVLLRNEIGAPQFSLRARAAGGLTYVSGEILGLLPIDGNVSILAGCTWLRARGLREMWPVWHHISRNASIIYNHTLQQGKVLQETSWTVAVSYDRDDLHAELQYRYLVQPALETSTIHLTYDGTRFERTVHTSLDSYPTVSLLLGFRL